MPYICVGLYLALAIYFAVHVVKSGRELYWLWILFMFPLLGSIVYLFAVYLGGFKSEVQHRYVTY